MMIHPVHLIHFLGSWKAHHSNREFCSAGDGGLEYQTSDRCCVSSSVEWAEVLVVGLPVVGVEEEVVEEVEEVVQLTETSNLRKDC